MEHNGVPSVHDFYVLRVPPVVGKSTLFRSNRVYGFGQPVTPPVHVLPSQPQHVLTTEDIHGMQSAKEGQCMSANGITALSFAIGLTVAIVAGAVLVPLFLKLSRSIAFRRRELPAENEAFRWWSLVFGTVERFFFCLVIGYGVGGGAVAMVAWIALKAHWRDLQAVANAIGDVPDARLWAQCSILTSVVSMLFALLGGLLMKHLSL